jgi:5S rRNA maturation endonuclease (ribonuclease M5)
VILRTEGNDKQGKHRKWFAHLRWDGSDWWSYKHDTPTPLYGLAALSKNPEYQVLIVEGEKDADAAAQALHKQKVVVTTWQGGTDSWASTDWEPLKARRIVGWPDADAPGMTCMDNVLSHLSEIGCTDISRVTVSAEDIAERHSQGAADIKSREMLKYLKSRVQDFVAGGETEVGMASAPPNEVQEQSPATPDPQGYEKALSVLCDEMDFVGVTKADQLFCPIKDCNSLIVESTNEKDIWLCCGLGHVGQEMFDAVGAFEFRTTKTEKKEPAKKKRKKRKLQAVPDTPAEPQKIFLGKEELRKRSLSSAVTTVRYIFC